MTDPQNLAPDLGQQRQSGRWWPRGVLPNALIALAAVGFLTGACLDACTQMNTIRRVPAIHGRMVDMETGQPIPGVQVTRWFEREMIVGPGGSDTYRVKASLRTVTSNATGSFEFPVWYGLGRGISSIEWTEYKPGWVAAWGNLSRVTTSPTFLVAQMKGDRNSVQIDTQRAGWALAVTLKLHRVDTPRAAEDHFSALRILLKDRVIQEEDSVKETVAYVEKHDLTEEMLPDIATLLPSGPCTTPYCRDPRIRMLARRLVEYCDLTPASPYCKPRAAFMIKRLRGWLESNPGHEE